MYGLHFTVHMYDMLKFVMDYSSLILPIFMQYSYVGHFLTLIGQWQHTNIVPLNGDATPIICPLFLAQPLCNHLCILRQYRGVVYTCNSSVVLRLDKFHPSTHYYAIRLASRRISLPFLVAPVPCSLEKCKCRLPNPVSCTICTTNYQTLLSPINLISSPLQTPYLPIRTSRYRLHCLRITTAACDSRRRKLMQSAYFIRAENFPFSICSTTYDPTRLYATTPQLNSAPIRMRHHDRPYRTL